MSGDITMQPMNMEQARASIERELRLRLDRDRKSRDDEAKNLQLAPEVRLQCLACSGVSAADARFCVHCSTKFNAKVVAP